MVKVTIDGVEVDVPAGSNVLQACEIAGKEVPRFCYHERLSVAGNCRMCLVEIEKAPPKPFASCAYPVAEGMVVHTDTPMVKKARRGVMEFLLINHPLDCPICDQGGECDLQDQAVGYGSDTSRYAENKRAVKDKYLGPLIKTVMTRCIHCTRCIRFSTEIAGVSEMGATARGEGMEVGTYVEKALTSELSGNLIDICPVGALTSKPYAFVARPWELKKTDSIDVMDAVGSNIRIDSRGSEVLRILPRLNEEVNEEWLADKSRFALDGLKRRRLDTCWVRQNGTLARSSWKDAFAAIEAKLNELSPSQVGAIAGDLADAESMTALKDLMKGIGSQNTDCRADGSAFDVTRRIFYTFNSSIAGIDEADAILLIGTHPRSEAPLINARIRKRWLAGGVAIGLVGRDSDLTYPVMHLGDGPKSLEELRNGASPFADVLRSAKRPMLILGAGALTRPDGAAIHAAAWALATETGMLKSNWTGFNVLQSAAARVAGLDLGFLPGPGGQNSATMVGGGVGFLWLLGVDNTMLQHIPKTTFVVYQGHHGDLGADRADVILPGAAYTEKNATYVNTEGRVQRCQTAVMPPGEAREDWKIIRAFSGWIGRPLAYDSIQGLRSRMEAINPIFSGVDYLPRSGGVDPTGPYGDPAAVGDGAFARTIANYYQTDPISRASPTMAECAAIVTEKPAQAAE